jgi:hypothetical protein
VVRERVERLVESEREELGRDGRAIVPSPIGKGWPKAG